MDRPQHLDVDALQAGMALLTELRLTAAGLDHLLVQVAGLAVGVVPGSDGAGLTLFRPGRSDVLVATDAFVAGVDTVQYAVGEGPCILACAEGHAIRSGAVISDPRWPHFGAAVSALDVGSVLSLPLTTVGEVIGSINLYAHGLDAFSVVAAELGESFAAPAAVAVAHARVLASAAEAVTEIRTSLAARATVDQAIGIILATEQMTVDTAGVVLDALATAADSTLLEVAQVVVDTATGQDPAA